MQPVGPDDLAPLFPMDLILQEVSTERYIRHPGGGAGRLPALAAVAAVPGAPAGSALGTPARIYYKYEGVSPAGSHKPNTAVPQAYYNAKAGVQEADHRDRRRPVGHRAGLRLLRCSDWSARCGRSARPTTRSPTGAR